MNIFTSKRRHLANKKKEILTYLLVNCASQPSVRKIAVKFSRGKWSRFSSGGSIKAAKHKLISLRPWPWWMITKANKDIANRKHTYLLYGNVNCISNCISKAKASDSQVQSGVDHGLYVSHVICAWLLFQLMIPDNARLRKLRVLHPTKFWIFSPIDKNSVLSR